MKEGQGCAQYGGNRILSLVFRDQPTGFLIDVGAADGWHNSNSIGLLKRPGWKGILIEPELKQHQKLQEIYKDRPGVICINCGIGMEEGEKLLYTSGQVSTFKKEVKEVSEVKYKNVQYGKQSATVMKLSTLLKQLKIKDLIDFLSIDAEGMDYEVWKSLDGKYFPKLVCMEGRGYMMDGYRELCRVGDNTFYLRGDECNILERMETE